MTDFTRYMDKYYELEVKYSGDILVSEPIYIEHGKTPKTKDNSFGFTEVYSSYELAVKAAIKYAHELQFYGQEALWTNVINGMIKHGETEEQKIEELKQKQKVEEEPEATAETVEETAEQEETEVKTKMYWAAVRNKETNQLEVIKRDDYSSKKDFAHDLRANGYAVRFISTPDKFDEDCENYYWECEKRQNVRKCVSESKERMEIAEQETELNAEVAQVEAEQTAEPETFSYEFTEIHKITISKRNNVYVEEFFEKMGGSYVKLGEEAWGCIEDIEEYYGIKINRNVQTDTEESESESESEPTAENITVSGTITHTGYFDTS